MSLRQTAAPVFVLPDALRYKGEPSAWARMTRPGHQMHSFLEAAFFDDACYLWLTDVSNGRIFRISPKGDWQLVHQIDGVPHAMRIAPDGRHIAVDYRHGLIELTEQGVFDVLSTGLEGQPFLGLSDMCFAPDDTLWFTDSGRSSLSDPVGRVYCLTSAGELRLILDCVPYANGICLSPDGAWVYVAATRSNQVWRLSSQFTKGSKPMVGTFLNLSGGLGPDGLAINAHGYLAVAQAQAGRAYVFDALGHPIVEICLPEGLWTTSVAFHPNNQNQLYIVDAQTGTVFISDISD